MDTATAAVVISVCGVAATVIINLFGGSNAAAIASGYMASGAGSHPIQAGAARIAAALSALLLA